MDKFKIGGDKFKIDTNWYKWMTIGEMKKNENMMQKNDDVIAFVSSKLERDHL